MYLTYNEGKSVVTQRFIRTLKIKIFKHMIAISKNVYFDVLHDILNKYNNAVHRSIKMKPTDVLLKWFLCWIQEDFNEKEPKFKNSDNVRISKYKNIFAKEYTQNWSEETFVVSKLKIQFRGLMLLVT